MAELFTYRRVKHGRPAKMKVMAEGLLRPSWLERLSPIEFVALVSAGALVAVVVGSSAAHPENMKIIRGQVDALVSMIASRSAEVFEAKQREASTRIVRVKSSKCHPSYSPCLPIVSDADCLGGGGNWPAFSGRVRVIGPDVYGLDGDGDGIGCE